MVDPQQALGAALREPPRTPWPRRRALVIGAGGALGSAVMEQLLGGGGFERVGALVEQAMRPALRGFEAVHEGALEDFAADTALIVFDRQRAAHGRELVFVRPAPAALPALAGRLHAAGVRGLVVVVPHTPTLLPMALQQGLASLDEAAVAALGFEHLVFMRMARLGAAGDAVLADAPRRLARWMLSQLHWMVPQREQPLRAETVARVAAALADGLPDAPPGTRVLPAALLWQATREPDARALVRAWWRAGPGAAA